MNVNSTTFSMGKSFIIGKGKRSFCDSRDRKLLKHDYITDDKMIETNFIGSSNPDKLPKPRGRPKAEITERVK